MSSSNNYIISGIQQVGVGIPDLENAWAWYRKQFGMDVPVFQDAAEAPLMTQYTGNAVQRRTAALALNMAGGAGFEIWQYTSRKTVPPAFTPALGDLGIFAVKMKSPDVAHAARRHKDAGVTLLGEVGKDPAGRLHYFVADQLGNVFEVTEGDTWFGKSSAPTGGVAGVIVGTSDVEKARRLYSDVLGYDEVVYDTSGAFDDLSALPGGERNLRRVLLRHSQPRKGAFSRLLGPSTIELVQSTGGRGRKIFADRYWGDGGFIHLCFDIRGMEALEGACKEAGFPFTIDSGRTFDMGEAGGRFSYIEDPDGTLVEFVETHRIPIVKKLGWHLNVGKRPPEKPLPDWMLRLLALGRIRS